MTFLVEPSAPARLSSATSLLQKCILLNQHRHGISATSRNGVQCLDGEFGNHKAILSPQGWLRFDLIS
jgi:hypothetical protein